ncbi:16S rRNA (cytosine(1402)-N(4))-methyltransferase [Candidatus Uhrbacteria bacterium RIFCSPLOWO2_01_FULL_53_9]|uniref:Ribosomal RNA small subunit methyltransferase H n=2 Tax=Candidatus Uhriibacteriota TaxID=1752732 RepID=A0A1F7UX82_9BACT|nr:MAG: 16S rRNA (cytosine(1402)-N(4))-methyltransferase [Candidatus Uhrbacteria bacterium RIFCSPHIGHO2_02_FULL_53_13]OGL82879.1 MAG: 16S rRNA (cytosine(1402)-N(4))-methyltransferase [Candidatus Uhrbacteria bacterium RIFCSPLOWO2_01_FULL_53_9]
MHMDHLHAPVLLEEVQHWMRLKPGGVYVDGTLGHGGHARMMLEGSEPNGVVIGIERDLRNLETAREQLQPFGSRAKFVHGNYRDLLNMLNGQMVDGILLDLGFSSAHVDDPERGFSFQADGPLDMRYDTSDGVTAADIVNGWPVAELANLFLMYGEEVHADRIARALVEHRRHGRFATTTDLAQCIERVVPRHGRLHPATRVFQALRIAVNDELGALQDVLPQTETALKPGGRLLIITFHSLEDRIVKRFMKSSQTLTSLTKKPVVATLSERTNNPRARSAKLRVAEKRHP